MFLVHLSRRCKCTIVTMRCLKRNSTKLYRKLDVNVLYPFVFFRPIGKTIWPPWPLIGWDIFEFPLKPLHGNQQNLTGSKISMFSTKFVFLGPFGKQDGRPGLWLTETFSTSPLKPLNGIQLNLIGRKISTFSTKFVFFGRWEKKQDGRTGIWFAETFLTFPLKPLNRIQRNLTGSKISMSSTPFVLFGLIGNTRWPHVPLICWDIFDFSSETAERPATKLDRMQDLNVLFQVCVFWADRKKDGHPGLWLTETFSTSPLKPLNVIQRNLTGSKISTFSTKFGFFGPIGKNKMAALASDLLRHFWLLWNRWTEFNETWQEARSQCPLPVRVIRADRKYKMAARASDWLSYFRLILWNRWTEFNETWQEERSRRPLPLLSLCILGRSEKQDGRPGQSVKKVAHCTRVHDMWPFGPLVQGKDEYLGQITVGQIWVVYFVWNDTCLILRVFETPVRWGFAQCSLLVY